MKEMQCKQKKYSDEFLEFQWIPTSSFNIIYYVLLIQWICLMLLK